MYGIVQKTLSLMNCPSTSGYMPLEELEEYMPQNIYEKQEQDYLWKECD